MPNDNPYADWAKRMLESLEASPPASASTPAKPVDGLTQDARDLLQSVDAGGVPVFVSANLRRIAADNGIVVDDDWTPNQIIAAIRARAGRT